MMHVFVPRATTFNRAAVSDRNKCNLLTENLSKHLLPCSSTVIMPSGGH